MSRGVASDSWAVWPSSMSRGEVEWQTGMSATQQGRRSIQTESRSGDAARGLPKMQVQPDSLRQGFERLAHGEVQESIQIHRSHSDRMLPLEQLANALAGEVRSFRS